MTRRSNSQFLGASDNEFFQIWALGGDASLNLSTHGGRANISFNCTIGQPGAPHSLPPFHAPTPAPHPPPHHPCRGQDERERNRRHAAGHQAARVEASAPVSSSPQVLLSTETVTIDSPASVVNSAPLPEAATDPVPVSDNSPVTDPVTFQLPAKETPATVTDQAVQEMPPLLLPVKSVAIPHTGAAPE